MLDWLGPSTPYRLKRVMSESVEDFFPVPHTSFYAEPARLAGAGYLEEHVERGGPAAAHVRADRARARRRCEAWLAEPETRPGEFRFPGMLKIFFGADPAGFAGRPGGAPRRLAERFEAVRDAAAAGRSSSPRAARGAGDGHRAPSLVGGAMDASSTTRRF